MLKVALLFVEVAVGDRGEQQVEQLAGAVNLGDMQEALAPRTPEVVRCVSQQFTDPGGMLRCTAGERPHRAVGVVAASPEPRGPRVGCVEDGEPARVAPQRLPETVMQRRHPVFGDWLQDAPLVLCWVG